MFLEKKKTWDLSLNIYANGEHNLGHSQKNQ